MILKKIKHSFTFYFSVALIYHRRVRYYNNINKLWGIVKSVFLYMYIVTYYQELYYIRVPLILKAHILFVGKYKYDSGEKHASDIWLH